MIFHKIEQVKPLQDYRLEIVFEDKCVKTYPVGPLFSKFLIFNKLIKFDLFNNVKVAHGGYGIVWDDEIDLSCNELWANGTETTS